MEQFIMQFCNQFNPQDMCTYGEHLCRTCVKADAALWARENDVPIPPWDQDTFAAACADEIGRRL